MGEQSQGRMVTDGKGCRPPGRVGREALKA